MVDERRGIQDADVSLRRRTPDPHFLNRCSKTPSGVPEGREDVCFRAYARSAYCWPHRTGHSGGNNKEQCHGNGQYLHYRHGRRIRFPEPPANLERGCTIYCRYSG